jgi:hypothetical protein
LNGLNFADIIAKGNVTGVDIAVDIFGVHREGWKETMSTSGLLDP